MSLPSRAEAPPPIDAGPAYVAFLARDSRFDGRLFVGVTTTGVYCRPVCRVRTPLAPHCRFFGHAAAAEAAGFRPCLRCRPELAPGWAATELTSRLAWAAAQRLQAGPAQAGRLEELASRLGISDRHLRRVFRQAFGVSPVDYAQTQRLLMAKRLLTDTCLPVTEVALAAGFGSLRRLQTLFRSRYGLAPSVLRRNRRTASQPVTEGVARSASIQLDLAYRPPLDWPRLLGFLAARALPGVEVVDLPGVAGAPAGAYRRSLRLRRDPLGNGEDGGGDSIGWIEVTLSARADALRLTLSPALLPVLPGVLAALRRLFDLDGDPQAVAAVLGPLAVDAPGLRLPGCVDGFELAVRAVLGQQITVKAAHTLAGRLVAALGEPFEAADRPPGLTHIFPTPERLAEAAPETIGALGIVRQRVTALQALARAVVLGQLELGPAADVEATLTRLEALPGIGPWTARYIALRALAWPDAWPSGDVALMRALGVVDPREADRRAEAWRPWRGYATLHLWRRVAEGAPAWPSTEKDPE